MFVCPILNPQIARLDIWEIADLQEGSEAIDGLRMRMEYDNDNKSDDISQYASR